jgi:hypothetical protein
MTKRDDHVHVAVMFTAYTEDTNPNKEFAELTYETTCTGYLAYPFQNEEGNNHAVILPVHDLMRILQRKKLVQL